MNPIIGYGQPIEGYDRRKNGTGPENICHPDAWNDIGHRLEQIQKYVRPPLASNAGLALGVRIGTTRLYRTLAMGYRPAPVPVVLPQVITVSPYKYYKVVLTAVPKTVWGDQWQNLFFVTGWNNGAPAPVNEGVGIQLISVTEDPVELPEAGPVSQRPNMTWTFWIWNAEDPTQSLTTSPIMIWKGMMADTRMRVG